MKEIEKNSRFNFFYSEDLKDLDKVTSISVSDASLKNTLDALLKETAITFREQGVNIVYLFPKGTNPVTNDATKTLTGTVTDETGEAIIGANVVEKGKPGNGTATDLDGKYTLELPVNATLEVSYLGYTKQEVSVAGKTTINITLAENAKDLDEVIVIGYGTIKKADLTGAVASVGGEKLANLQATSISQALQGSMPGVQITRSGSMPGDGATIRVRGVTTIGTSDPLILIDGIPGSLNNVNVDDIESISVLKDAASASIYGARASAGVVLVTTKRAKEGSLSIDYSGTLGFVKATTFPGVVDYKRYMEMNNEVAWNDAGNVPGNEYFVYSKDYIESYAENNLIDPGHYPIADWKSYLINNSAPRQKHNLSMSYGNAVVKTKASVGYEKTDALYDHRSYESVTARVNNTIKLNKYLSASVDGSYLRTISERPQVNPLTAAYVYGPLWSPVWPDGRISDGRNGTNTYARLHYGGFNNTWGDHFTGRIALDFTPVKNFTITGVYAPTVSISKGKNFVKQIPYYEMNDPTLFAGYIAGHLENSLSESRGESRTTTKQLLANYAITLDKVHELSLLAGYEDYYAFSESLGASSNMMELSNYPYLDRGNLNFMTNSGTASENAYRSLFGRINYSFGDRYLLQANIRSDESSRFHRNYRRGTFPSVSAGWVITEEPSLKTADLGPLSFLKFRGSWGNLGNERVGNYPYQAIMAFGNAIFVNSAGVVEAVTTSAQQTYNVLDITWERTEVLDGGIDVALLNNRLSLSFDYYEKTTHDMLLALEIPDLMGYNNPQQNAGIMNTKGWDLLVEWKDKIGDLRYSISANLSDYKSVMGNLSGGVVFGDGTIIRKGSEYNEWYGYLSDGLFQTAEEVASSPTLTASTKPGDVKFKDVSGPDGVPDGKITPDYDRVLLGGSLPRYIYGGTINAGYKGIDLSLAFQGVGKQKSLLTSDQVYQTAGWYTFPDFVDGHYFSNLNTPEQNAQAKYPRLSQIGYQGNNYKMSDYWLIDGSYFRLKNITLGYTLPKHIVNRTQLSNVRLWASASDLFSISKFPKGWDPEAGTTSYITKGFNFGIQVKF
ncbi:MAG: TonB-dependent receptor [Candidatus Symbiothrix sp.]|nr:TonB-dependent receptor [Candidatus Symbiothrix sp.]